MTVRIAVVRKMYGPCFSSKSVSIGFSPRISRLSIAPT